jgi:hypothetical protein
MIMKKRTVFVIVTALLSATVATLSGFEIDTFQYWIISLLILVAFNVIYFFCENDNIDLLNEIKECPEMPWVMVSETKPVAGQWFLVFSPLSGRHIAWYNGIKFEDRADYDIKNVTHWMQIPAAK